MKLEDAVKLTQKKYREESGHFLVEGEHLLQELIKAAADQPALRSAELWVTAQHEHLVSPFRTRVITPRQMQKLSETRSPQGIVAVVPQIAPPPPTPDERVIYLYQIQDPGNLGTIMRSLAWFGRFRCLLSPDSVDPYNAKAIRAGVGALFRVPCETDVSTDALRARYPSIAWLHTTGASIETARFRSFDAYLFGNEARGIAATLITELDASPFSIPGAGALESLNVATAVSIAAFVLGGKR
jgi:TrmH family RNA methyltransferase